MLPNPRPAHLSRPFLAGCVRTSIGSLTAGSAEPALRPRAFGRLLLSPAAYGRRAVVRFCGLSHDKKPQDFSTPGKPADLSRQAEDGAPADTSRRVCAPAPSDHPELFPRIDLHSGSAHVGLPYGKSVRLGNHKNRLELTSVQGDNFKIHQTTIPTDANVW